MNLADKLESIDCRRDEKARRVLNSAPDTVANITAEELERGVTLEALEALNVPVYRYGGQVTIHGVLPDFNPSARPGGYKAVFRNGNGSIGVKYSAIDTAKKELIAKVARVSQSGWQANSNASGFELSRAFYVRDETKREEVKQQAIAALRSIPVNLFFGGAYAGCLAYGAGYYVSAYIGAISESDVWPFISQMLGVKDEADFVTQERAKAERDAAQRAANEVKWEQAKREREQAEDAKHARIAAVIADKPGTRLTEFAPKDGTELSFTQWFINYDDEVTSRAVRIYQKRKGGKLYVQYNGEQWGRKLDYSDSRELKDAAKRGELIAL